MANSRSRLSRRLVWPATTAALMLLLTLSLGVWQVQRLAWKRSLLQEIDRAETTDPVPLGIDPAPFSRVVATGQLRPDVARYGAEVRTGPMGAVMGARVLGLLDRPDAPPILVDRGWAPIDAFVAPPAGPVRVTGYVRPPEIASWSAVADDTVHGRFFTLDPARIAAAMGASVAAPFTLVALGPPGGVPEPSQTLPRPPNDHLSYAITWFSLSAVLVAVFIVFVGQTVRKEHGHERV